ncbi:hypothetical protein F5887DRAFT_918098 [Amanita rubescens]|nr:hypothetical protein F5887DRAFT_918098 [Amanita rubescens]
MKRPSSFLAPHQQVLPPFSFLFLRQGDRFSVVGVGVVFSITTTTFALPVLFVLEFEFSSFFTSLTTVEAEGRLGFLAGLTGGKVDAPDEKLNFLNKVLNVPAGVELKVEVDEVDGGGGTTGCDDDESGRDGCDWDDDDRGASKHGDGDEYDLPTAEDDSDLPGRGDEDDTDKKWDIDSDIDILLFLFFQPMDDDDPATAEPEPEPKLEFTLEAEPGVEVEANDGSSILSIPNCFPTTLPKVDKAGVKYSADPAPELDNELGLSTALGGDDVEKTREVGDDKGEIALVVDDRPLPNNNTFSLPLTSTPPPPT